MGRRRGREKEERKRGEVEKLRGEAERRTRGREDERLRLEKRR